MKNYIPIISIFLCLFFFSCNGNNTRTTQETDNETLNENTEATIEESETEQSPNTWNYSKDVDDLSGNVTAVNADIDSENVIEYESGKTVRLFISITYGSISRRIQNYVTIGLIEDKYDICRISDFQGSGFLATFDDGPIDDTWSLVFLGPTRKALTIHELDQVADFISKIKQSKKCKIQVNLESIGNRTFEFNTKGLEWNWE